MELSAAKVVFENSENEFPQRVIYSLKEDQLTARIEGKIDGQTRAMEWKWEKASKSEIGQGAQ